MHYIMVEDFLEEWYDRSAEDCDLFENISQVNKYTRSCTECRYFESGCGVEDRKGPNIIRLLQTVYRHDGLIWDHGQP